MAKKQSKSLSEKAVEAAEKLFSSACDRVLKKGKPTDEALKYFERALKVYNSTIDCFGAGGGGGQSVDPLDDFEKKRKEKTVCQGCDKKFTNDELAIYRIGDIYEKRCEKCGATSKDLI